MDYPTLRLDGLPVGSGAIESATDHLGAPVPGRPVTPRPDIVLHPERWVPALLRRR